MEVTVQSVFRNVLARPARQKEDALEITLSLSLSLLPLDH